KHERHARRDVPPWLEPSRLDRLEIEEKGEQEERRREKVLSDRNPGHRLDVGWVNREEEPRQQREGEPSEEPTHDEHCKPRVDRVEEHGLKVVAEGTQAPERVVHHVRDEMEREVIGKIRLREDVKQVLARESADPWVLDDVRRVVPARQEGEPKRARVNEERDPENREER